MARRNAEVPKERRMEFRIGINLGDIIVEADDIFGDGVNVAARLEALAEPGGICVAGWCATSRDKLDVSSRTWASSGSRTSPGRYAPTASSEADSAHTSPTRRSPQRRGPSPTGRQSLCCRSTIDGRRRAGVLLRRHHRGHHHGAVEMALFSGHRPQFHLRLQGRVRRSEAGRRELGVRYVLEGSVRKPGRRVRISCQLFDAADGANSGPSATTAT